MNIQIENETSAFPANLKNAVLSRDSYKCVICGMGIREGIKVGVSRIIPDMEATGQNAWTLCERHLKASKSSSLIGIGKQMFIQMLKASKEEGQTELADFASDVLAVYEKHNINGHIVWNK